MGPWQQISISVLLSVTTTLLIMKLSPTTTPESPLTAAAMTPSPQEEGLRGRLEALEKSVSLEANDVELTAMTGRLMKILQTVQEKILMDSHEYNAMAEATKDYVVDARRVSRRNLTLAEKNTEIDALTRKLNDRAKEILSPEKFPKYLEAVRVYQSPPKR